MEAALIIYLGFFVRSVNAQNCIDITRFNYGNTPLHNFENTLEQTNFEKGLIFGAELLYRIRFK